MVAEWNVEFQNDEFRMLYWTWENIYLSNVWCCVISLKIIPDDKNSLLEHVFFSLLSVFIFFFFLFILFEPNLFNTKSNTKLNTINKNSYLNWNCSRTWEFHVYFLTIWWDSTFRRTIYFLSPGKERKNNYFINKSNIE